MRAAKKLPRGNGSAARARLPRWALGAVLALAVAACGEPAPSVAGEGGTRFQDCPVCPEMVVIPPGRFLMGTPDGEPDRRPNEGPRHQVTISRPFALGRFEVTFEEWDACVAEGACAPPLDDRGWGRGRRPVIYVNWYEVQQYLEWLRRQTGRAYRLPSEAEWEYAARAGSTTSRWWGESPADACLHANVADRSGNAAYRGHWESVHPCDDGEPHTAPVGRYRANAFGLHDMLGNVEEWLADCWNESYAGAPADGSPWLEGDCGDRVARGGSWDSWLFSLRSGYRDRNRPGHRNMAFGFRVALSLE